MPYETRTRRNIRGRSDAYALDLLIARMQNALLRGSGQIADLKIELMDRLAALHMHLNPVREKAEIINRVKADDFWKNVSIAALDEVRKPLREIMHHRERCRGQALLAKIVDIAEDDAGIHYSRRSASLKTVDMKAYRQIVENELKKHFAINPTLKKIRAGEAVSESDINSLVSLILTQSPDASRAVLAEFFAATAEPLQFAIRAVIGMDAEAVQAKFAEFARKYPKLSAKQTLFLGLLQNHIALYGSITVEKLYEAPFTVVDADGLDGVFKNEDEVTDLLHVIRTLGPPVARGEETHSNKRSENNGDG